MKKYLARVCYQLALISLLCATHAGGATITWDPIPTNVDVNNPSQVCNTGTLFAAASALSLIHI